MPFKEQTLSAFFQGLEIFGWNLYRPSNRHVPIKEAAQGIL
jgi:hypothetical protein